MSRITGVVGSLKTSLREKILRTKLREGWVSVMLGAEALAVAHVRRRTGEKPEVLSLSISGVAEDVVAVMGYQAKELELKSCNCTLLLNPGQYQMLQIELPAVPDEEVKDAVRWSIKDMVDFPAELMSLDVAEIPDTTGRAGKTRQGFAVVADDALIAEKMALFNTADARIEAIDIPEMAIRNVSALFEEPERGLAMLTFDDERTTLTFTFRGELYAVRQIDISRSRLEQADGDWRQQIFDRIGLETQRSLDNFERLHGHISISRLLLSPLPGVAGLMQYLQEYLSLPVGEVDLAEVLDITLVPELSQPGQQASYLKLIGAALRE